MLDSVIVTLKTLEEAKMDEGCPMREVPHILSDESKARVSRKAERVTCAKCQNFSTLTWAGGFPPCTCAPTAEANLLPVAVPSPEDPEVLHISGPVPVVDLKSANAVIDEERKKVRDLEEKLAEAEKTSARRLRDYEQSSSDWAKETHESARWKRKHKGVLWGAGVMLALLVGLAVWSINEHLSECRHDTGGATAQISQENPTDRYYFSTDQDRECREALDDFKKAFGAEVVANWLKQGHLRNDAGKEELIRGARKLNSLYHYPPTNTPKQGATRDY